MIKRNMPILLIYLLLSVLSFIVFNRFMYLYSSYDTSIYEKILLTINDLISSLVEDPLSISFTSQNVLIGFVGIIIIWLLFVYNNFNRKRYMPGIEHGSATWGERKDIRHYVDKSDGSNIILTKSEKLSMSDRMKQTSIDDYNRNKNVLVIGGSGSGKTRYFVKPNIMQMHSSYVITDPKGILIHDMGKMLMDNGYKIKVFDLINRDKSDHYNPFVYLRTADDILKLINNMITNTNTSNKSSNDFWEKSEIAFLEAIFGFILFEGAKEEKNIATVMDLIRLAEVKEDDENYMSVLDIMFEELKNENPDHFAVKQYDIYKFAAGRTAKSILISVGVRLAPFNIDSIRNIVSNDTIGLDMIGSEKTALFIIIPDTDKSFNFLAAIMYQQMFDTLVYKADHEYMGKLPYNVRCMMDEFSNIGQIPMLEILIATMRSRGISLNIILQNLSQIKSIYKDTWEIITGNCDSLLFLGGMEQTTLEYISKMCGKTTIDNQNISQSKGEHGSYSLNDQIVGRDLITSDEVGSIKGKQCVLKIRGCNPFLSYKYPIDKHKNYKYISELYKANWFDIEQRDSNQNKIFFSNCDVVEVFDYTAN